MTWYPGKIIGDVFKGEEDDLGEGAIFKIRMFAYRPIIEICETGFNCVFCFDSDVTRLYLEWLERYLRYEVGLEKQARTVRTFYEYKPLGIERLGKGRQSEIFSMFDKILGELSHTTKSDIRAVASYCHYVFSCIPLNFKMRHFEPVVFDLEREKIIDRDTRDRLLWLGRRIEDHLHAFTPEELDRFIRVLLDEALMEFMPQEKYQRYIAYLRALLDIFKLGTRLEARRF